MIFYHSITVVTSQKDDGKPRYWLKVVFGDAIEESAKGELKVDLGSGVVATACPPWIVCCPERQGPPSTLGKHGQCNERNIQDRLDKGSAIPPFEKIPQVTVTFISKDKKYSQEVSI